MPDPVARLRAICLALPEVQERNSHGEPAFFIGPRKQFVCVDDHHDGDWAEVAEIVRDAYRQVAPKRLVARLE